MSNAARHASDYPRHGVAWKIAGTIGPTDALDALRSTDDIPRDKPVLDAVDDVTRAERIPW